MRSHRNLTPGEAKLARHIFGDALNYNNIRVVKTDRKKHVAITPFGSMYFPANDYKADFVGGNIYAPIHPVNDAHWFLHELVHVWQHYVGLQVVLRAIANSAKSGKYTGLYGYSLSPTADLLDFNLEQQGDIIADYYAWKLGWSPWSAGLSQPTAQYESVLKNFMADPTYPIEQRWGRKVRSALRGLDR